MTSLDTAQTTDLVAFTVFVILRQQPPRPLHGIRSLFPSYLRERKWSSGTLSPWVTVTLSPEDRKT